MCSVPPVAGRGAWARFMRHGTKGFGFVWGLCLSTLCGLPLSALLPSQGWCAHLCTRCTCDPTTIVPGPLAKSSPPPPLLCVFSVSGPVLVLLLLSLSLGSVWLLCSLAFVVSVCCFSLSLHYLLFLIMDVLPRTVYQVTILELQVACDVLLPGAACHSITIASQASTRTQAAIQCGAQCR